MNRYTIDTCQGINKSCIIMNIGLDTTRVRSLLAVIIIVGRYGSKSLINLEFEESECCIYESQA